MVADNIANWHVPSFRSIVLSISEKKPMKLDDWNVILKIEIVLKTDVRLIRSWTTGRTSQGRFYLC